MIDPIVVLKRTTAARASKPIYSGKSMQPADEAVHLAPQIFSVGLSAAEGFNFANLTDNDFITVQYWDAAAWRDLVIEGEVIRLNKDNTCRTVYGPGTFRLVKAVTDNSIGAVL